MIVKNNVLVVAQIVPWDVYPMGLVWSLLVSAAEVRQFRFEHFSIGIGTLNRPEELLEGSLSCLTAGVSSLVFASAHPFIAYKLAWAELV